MEWTAGVDAGNWIRERVDDPWRGTIHDVVPRGFAAYARVPHRSETPELPEGPSAELVAMIAGILTAHTTTPDDGLVGLWEAPAGCSGTSARPGRGPSSNSATRATGPSPTTTRC